MKDIINTIIRLPEKIPCDKRIHIIGGGITTIISLLILGTSNLDIIISLIILCVVSFGIEIYQKITNTGQFDLYDALATIVGGITVLIPFIIDKFIY